MCIQCRGKKEVVIEIAGKEKWGHVYKLNYINKLF